MIELVILVPIVVGLIGLGILSWGMQLVRDDEVGVVTRKMAARPASGTHNRKKWGSRHPS